MSSDSGASSRVQGLCTHRAASDAETERPVLGPGFPREFQVARAFPYDLGIRASSCTPRRPVLTPHPSVSLSLSLSLCPSSGGGCTAWTRSVHTDPTDAARALGSYLVRRVRGALGVFVFVS